MKKTKTLLVSALLMMAGTTVAQTNVTDKYIENPDFAARFAAWSNPGKFTYNVANNFDKKHGEVYMESGSIRARHSAPTMA